MRQFRFALALSALVAAAEVSHAQVLLQSLGYASSEEFDISEAFPPGMVVMHSSGADGEEAPAGPPSARLTALQKLDFDRRPSTILKVWSTPVKPPESKPAEAKPAEPAAAPAQDATPAEPPAPEGETEEQKAARLKAKADAEAAAAKAKEEAAKKAAEAKQIADEMAALQRNVTLGDWQAVRAYFATLTEAERKGGYEKLLQSLQNGPPQRLPVPQQGQMYVEKNQFSPSDVVGLATCSGTKLGQPQFAQLGAFLAMALSSGHQLETFLADVTPHLSVPEFGLDKRQLAMILVHANEPLSLEKLIPTREEAEASNDRDGLNLISRYCLAMHAKDSKPHWLEEAWRATQSVLAVGEVSDEAKGEALTRAVDIAPKIKDELGQAWLDESFTARPERGMEIVAAIGSATSIALSVDAMNSDKREKLLELESTAAKALLAAAPQLAASWASQLELLAGNWMREALVSYQFDESSGIGPRMQRDMYGNFFYYNYGGGYRGNAPTPITTGRILELRPDDVWLSHIDATLAPRFRMLFAQLYLKVGEEGLAFPYIEKLALELPRQTKELADEFLRVWTKNHDPNSERNRTNNYMYFYGFEERANGIPLTRSKQERNLRELSEYVARLRTLPVELDDGLMASAFTTCHSAAEIFRLESIEAVFGPVSGLEPGSIAGILQTMRANLVETWRDPALQEKNKTNRRQKDIQNEILRGYALGASTVDGVLAAHPDSWELWVVKAALAHDENNFRGEIAKDSEFSARRREALAAFGKAAELYAAAVPKLEVEKESTQVYDQWFYAALGACDPGAIQAQHLLSPNDVQSIRASIESLPGEAAKRHMSMFAGSLFTRMSNVGPPIKFRYVREGLAIVGDHKLAHEARAVYDYYKDLVTEIQLRATIDGSDRVGHDAPFGLAIDLRHTREIERESGGFAKYLQNQNTQSYGYNYGRPLEDYRDKFEEALRATLNEHFEVLSLTFNDPSVRSKADPEYGWRVTPYAYALIKPRSEAVDQVPALRMDLDFLDTTGYAVLPIESSPLPIDAKQGEPRPRSGLSITQMLDERQAKSGKLILEIKASANGLIGDFASSLDFAPAGFDIVSNDDHGVSVVKFSESESGGVDSERTWTITMQAQAGKPPAESFAFAKPKEADAKVEHFRYVDADLAAVGATIDLERRYSKPDRGWIYWLSGGVVALMALGWLGFRRAQRPAQVAAERFRVPDPVNPFTVLGLLRDIQVHDGLAPEQHRALGEEIHGLERHFFGAERDNAAPDLERIARTWVGRAKSPRA